MLLVIKPQKVEFKINICDFHKKNPGKSYAGCTCSGIYVSRDKKLEEYTNNDRIIE